MQKCFVLPSIKEPAFGYSDNRVIWYTLGYINRDDCPAIIRLDGTKRVWYSMGKLVCEDYSFEEI